MLNFFYYERKTIIIRNLITVTFNGLFGQK